jgi:hypothetical protein
VHGSMVELAMKRAAQAVASDRWTITTTPAPEREREGWHVEREGWIVCLESTSGRGARLCVHVTDPPTTIDFAR